jgi:hypothetical protein
LYSSPNIVRDIISKKMRWTGHTAYIRAGENHLGNLDTDGRKILKQIVKKWDEMARIGIIWLRIKTSDSLL